MSAPQDRVRAAASEDVAARQAGYVDARARGEYRRLATGCFLVAFMNAHSTLLSVIFARAGHDLHATGLLITAIAIPVIVFALFSSEVAARIGVLWTLRIAMALTTVGFASLQFTKGDFAAAYASRAVQGVGQGLFLSSVITYAQSRLNATRFVFLLGVLSAVMPLTQAIAPPFGEWVIGRWGDGFLFLLVSVPALVGIALTFSLRPLDRPAKARGLDLFASWKPAYLEPLLAVLLNGTMFGYATAYFASAFQARGLPLAAFFTASLVTMFSSRLLALRGVDSVNPRLLVAGGLALLSAGFVAVALSGRTVWPVVAGGIVFGFGYSLTYPMLSAWMSEGVPPERRAGPQAWLNGFFNFGLFAMPLPATWLIAATDYETVMLVLAALNLAFALWMAARGALRPSAR